MKLSLRFLLILTPFLLISCGSENNHPPKIEGTITQFGVYKRTGIVKREYAKNTAAGLISSSIIEFQEQTTSLSAELEKGFGFDYILTTDSDIASAKIDFVGYHPPITNPRGQTYEIDRFSRVIHFDEGQYNNSIIHGFSQEWEMVPGTWKLEMWYEEDLLLTKTFEVH